MDFQTLDSLRRTHPAWRLLAADNAPLIIGFLHRSFIETNVRTLSKQDLVSKLEDYLYDLRARLGAEAFPKSASQYLDDWAADERGWLRKFYPPASDEPGFDLTPATEKVLEWLVSLRQKQFVSTESRLMIVFDLLRQMTEGTQIDPAVRIAELEKRRGVIDAEIQRLREGHVELMEPTQIKDRFLQMASTARALLSDFREVEQNFRSLDRTVRERIATWEGGKGELLAQVFGQRDAISDSDQGRSFRAFWDFLMSPTRQEELSALLSAVFALEAVRELEPDPRLLGIHFDWLEAGEIAQRTVARLSAQFRRYLDEQALLENRRILHLIRGVEQHALVVREEPPDGAFMEMNDTAPAVDLAMERPLFSPPLKPHIADQVLVAGEQGIPADALFDQAFVDKTRLEAAIRRALQLRSQLSLAELLQTAPIEQGLAELVVYLSLASEDSKAVIDDAQTQTLTFSDDLGVPRQATLPLVIFNR